MTCVGPVTGCHNTKRSAKRVFVPNPNTTTTTTTRARTIVWLLCESRTKKIPFSPLAATLMSSSTLTAFSVLSCFCCFVIFSLWPLWAERINPQRCHFWSFVPKNTFFAIQFGIWQTLKGGYWMGHVAKLTKVLQVCKYVIRLFLFAKLRSQHWPCKQSMWPQKSTWSVDDVFVVMLALWRCQCWAWTTWFGAFETICRPNRSRLVNDFH